MTAPPNAPLLTLEQLSARVAALEKALVNSQRRRLLTVEEAAEEVRLEPGRILDAVQAGALAHVFPSDPRIHPQDLDDWCRANKVKAWSTGEATI